MFSSPRRNGRPITGSSVRRIQPNLEELENRCLPSLITVANLRDAGAGSLRQAILRANAAPNADTIQFAAGLRGTITLTSGELLITHNLFIRGPGTAGLSVSGNHASRVFNIAAGAAVTIANLTITRGFNLHTGGGILNQGALTLNNVLMIENNNFKDGGAVVSTGATARLTVINSKLAFNSSSQGAGGAIAILDHSAATIVHCSVVYNRAEKSIGGGVYISGLTAATIVRSNLAHNFSGETGGAIYNSGALTPFASSVVANIAEGTAGAIRSQGDATLIQCTVADNVSVGAFAGAGGIDSIARNLLIYNCTITGNSNPSTGAGGINFSTTVGGLFVINNSVVAENVVVGARGNDIVGAVNTGGGNFIGIGDAVLAGIVNGVNGNHIGTHAAPFDPQLGELQNNGGPTLTRLCRLGSQLINAGLNALVLQPTDQRGFRRIKFGIVDIGAVEFGATN